MVSLFLDGLINLFSLPVSSLPDVCPALEHRNTSSSLLSNPKKQGVAAVNSSRWREHTSVQKRRSRSQGDERGNRTRRRRRSAGEGARSGLQNPISERRERPQEDSSTRMKIRSQSLPRDVNRTNEDEEEDAEYGTVRGRRREGERGRSKHKEKKSRSRRSEMMAEGKEFEQEAPTVEESVDRRLKEGRVRVEESDEDVFLPIPSPTQKLPRPKENWKECDEIWDMAVRYRDLKRDKSQDDLLKDYEGEACSAELNEDEGHQDICSMSFERPLPGVAVVDPASHRKPFSFLHSSLSVDQLVDDESESGGIQSDGSVSAASVSSRSVACGVLPGLWLTPSQQRLVGEDHR